MKRLETPVMFFIVTLWSIVAVVLIALLSACCIMCKIRIKERKSRDSRISQRSGDLETNEERESQRLVTEEP